VKYIRLCIWISVFLLSSAFSTTWAIGDTLVLTLNEDWSGEVDVYIALSLPSYDGRLFFLTPDGFNSNMRPYSQVAQAGGLKEVFRLVLPELTSGEYTFYAVLMLPNTFQLISEIVSASLVFQELEIVAPTNLSAIGGDGEVSLSWDSVEGATFYNLYWKVADGAEQVIAVTIPPYTHSGLSNGTVYFYRVTAVSGSGVESAFSDVVSATPQGQSEVAPGEFFQDTLQDGSLGPEMVWIPAGTFRMGDIQGGGDSDEQPVHEVSVDGFAMGRFEVTFAEYDKFVEATGREKPDDEGWGRDDRPVIDVSWHDATAYAEWLSEQTGHTYRLPTEAEWEYSARAGTETKYWWGNEIGSNKANCLSSYYGDSFDYTAPVGSFDANQFGLYDTVGNLLEWTCSSYASSYNGEELQCVDNASLFVLRGGSWSNDDRWSRAASRIGGRPAERYRFVGFRLARTP
jgi:formylglycine-generating enzyme required for sulfatase activity